MNILFLDDNEFRCNIARLRFCDPIIVKTADEAISALNSQQEWEIVYLDHDLGGTEYAPSDENSGMGVVNHIIENNIPIKIIVVHSLNYPAAQNMVSKLRQANYNVEYLPFSTLIRTLP